MLIRHIRPRLRPAGNAVLRVRRGHPLAGGLVACIVTGGQYGLGRDLVTGADFTGTNSPTIGLGPDGPAADFSSTAYAEAPHDASWNVLGHVTVLWRGVIRTPSVLGYFVGKVPAGGNGGTNTPYSLEYNNGATAGPTWIRSNATGGDPYKIWKGPDNSIIADTPQTIAVSTDDTITTTPSIYIDGALVATTFIYGFGGGAPTGNTDPLRLARRQDGAEQQNGLTSLVMIAAAQWDAGQHALANLSPYGVLEEAPRYYFATPSASSLTATIAGTVAVTASVEADLALAATLSGTVAVTASLETDVALAATIGGTVDVTGALAAATTLDAVIDGTVDITASLSAGGERDAVIAGTVDITALIRATTGQGAVGGDDAPARREDVAKLSRRQRRLEREQDERAARLRATLERAYRAATGGDDGATEAALAEAAEIAPPAIAEQIADIPTDDGISQTLAGIEAAIAAIQRKKNVVSRDDDELAVILSVF